MIQHDGENGWRRTDSPHPADAAAASGPRACPLPKAARRLGAAAFLFFLVKGLLWLTVPAGIAVLRVWFGE